MNQPNRVAFGKMCILLCKLACLSYRTPTLKYLMLIAHKVWSKSNVENMLQNKKGVRTLDIQIILEYNDFIIELCLFLQKYDIFCKSKKFSKLSQLTVLSKRVLACEAGYGPPSMTTPGYGADFNLTTSSLPLVLDFSCIKCGRELL
ncbi:hypothetical protein NQ317_011432 [Molorchus minor]|uniref:Uncharacterized protein n=1 Tax=Molorchus minor TaxID=1323400 RepID=A0ABQ9JQJ6_9CUCU|nr:hypothetical protein NQ317_011432 [Molorchus minor]